MSHRCGRALLQLVLLSGVSSLVGCSGALYDHSYFQDISERCRQALSCNTNSSTTFSISRTCQCDDLCATYGDCCQDSPRFRPSSLSACITAGDWNTAADYKDSYYMVKSCPSSWVREETRSRCENYMETIRQEPILGLPITSSATNITYPNYYCARCNDDLHMSTMIRWKLAVTCSTSLLLPVPDINTVLRESTYGEDFKFKAKFANASYHTCKLYVWRPFELLRRCHERIVDSCATSWRNDTVKAKCEAYTSLVFRLNYKPFRNPHCATCNNVPNKLMRCTKDGLTIETSFPTLFDFSDSSSDVVGKTRVCVNHNEAYDPIAKKCRHIIWSIAGEDDYFEVDSCSGNISKCNILNCSKFLMEPKKYLLNDNFTVTDLLSNKLYANGEFRIMDDGRVEVCARYQITEDKFDSVMTYMTFLGLGVSIGFLFLHLVAFTINSTLRNLSGKCLASLCTALILAYGSFITGHLVQVGGMGCKVAAVATYYSFMSSFSWLLLMAFDVWRTLRLSTVRLRIVSRESRRYVFFTYSTLGWIILPGSLASVAIGVQGYQGDHALSPGFGIQNCWFGNRKALTVFFAIPVGTIMVLNLVFFMSSAFMICRTTVSSSIKSASTHRDYRLFLRLAILMGLTWIVGFIADYLNLNAIWYIFVALNAFQGFFIFVAFTWTKKVRSGLRSQVTADTKSNCMKKDASCWTWTSNRTGQTENTEVGLPLKRLDSTLPCNVPYDSN